MAEHRCDDQLALAHCSPTNALESMLPDKGPLKGQVLAVVTGLLPGGFLLLLAGLTLTGTLIGLAVATPIFVIFSPILVPTALTRAMAVFGFLTSGAFGITTLSALSWIIKNLRGFGWIPEQLDQAKKRTQDTAGQMGQRTRETGQKAREAVSK